MRVKIILFTFFTLAIIAQYLANAKAKKVEQPADLISLPCFLENAPCTKEEQVFKDEILKMIKTNCIECDDTQKVLVGELTWRLKEWFTEEYDKLSQKYQLENK